MAALQAHLTATRILHPEEHRPAPRKRQGITVIYDSLALLTAFYQITEVGQTQPEPNQTVLGDVDSTPPLKRWSSDIQITSPQTPSRTQNVTSGVSAQVEFLSDQEIFIPNRPTSVDKSTIGPLAQRIFRAHFLTDILSELSNLAKFARSEQAPNYAVRLFRAMRFFTDRLPTDPFSAIVFALHDALAFDNNWIRYTAEQYLEAGKILVRFGNQDLNENKALKAIAALEDVGFDTTPFSLPDDDASSA
jgi:hypothetical protein